MSRFKAHWSASSQGEVEQSPPGCLLVKGPKERDDGHAASTQQAAQTLPTLPCSQDSHTDLLEGIRV